MAADVCNYYKLCQTCQACKLMTRAQQGQLQPLFVPEY